MQDSSSENPTQKHKLDSHEYAQKIIDDIPVFTKETAKSLDVKLPGWLVFMNKKLPTISTLPKETPKKRGRPRVHNLPPPPEHVTVNKISDQAPICNPCSKPFAGRLIKEYKAIKKDGYMSMYSRIQLLAEKHKLPYATIRDAIADAL
jgi:hypothetical protein